MSRPTPERSSAPAPLTATLGEIAGPRPGAPREPAPPSSQPPVAGLELPTDRPLVTAAGLAQRVVAAGTPLLHATAAVGCAAALVARALARRDRKIVCVTADVDAARALAADVSFL